LVYREIKDLDLVRVSSAEQGQPNRKARNKAEKSRPKNLEKAHNHGSKSGRGNKGSRFATYVIGSQFGSAAGAGLGLKAVVSQRLL